MSFVSYLVDDWKRLCPQTQTDANEVGVGKEEDGDVGTHTQSFKWALLIHMYIREHGHVAGLVGCRFRFSGFLEVSWRVIGYSVYRLLAIRSTLLDSGFWWLMDRQLG